MFGCLQGFGELNKRHGTVMIRYGVTFDDLSGEEAFQAEEDLVSLRLTSQSLKSTKSLPWAVLDF